MSPRAPKPGPASPAPAAAAAPSPAGQKVSFYPAWCKRCGNCVAFCPREALGHDEWGYPHLANPERCTACGLCEMLCPDFAISVGGAGPAGGETAPAARGQAAPTTSPERLAPEPGPENNGGGRRGGEGGRG